MKLYGYRNGRTLRALWALEEVGAEYGYAEVDLLKGKGRSAAFLAINPAGKVPVLIDNGQTITESAAICLHLAERYPDRGLLPPPGSAERTDCYRWMSFVMTELDAPLWTIAKHRFALPKEKRVPAVLDTAAWEYGIAAGLLAQELAGKTYLAGSCFSVADILAGHTLLWARSARIDASNPVLEAYLSRLQSREAFERAERRAAL